MMKYWKTEDIAYQGDPFGDAVELTEEEFLILNRKQNERQEILRLKTYLTSTDYIYPKCLELGLDVNTEYAEVVEQRKTTRARIQEIEGA